MLRLTPNAPEAYELYCSITPSDYLAMNADATWKIGTIVIAVRGTGWLSIKSNLGWRLASSSAA